MKAIPFVIAVAACSFLSLGLVYADDEPAGENVEKVETETTDANTYVVKEGDSWWKIAYVTYKERGISSLDLRNANPDVRVLKVGAKLFVPEASEEPEEVVQNDAQPEAKEAPATEETTYVVKEGDSWWKIAHVDFKDRELSWSDIHKANNGAKLEVGLQITIPAKKQG